MPRNGAKLCKMVRVGARRKNLHFYRYFQPKWAPDRPNLWPRTAKFDLSRLLVGPSRPASFLSVLFPGRGRFSSRSDSNHGTCFHSRGPK